MSRFPSERGERDLSPEEGLHLVSFGWTRFWTDSAYFGAYPGTAVFSRSTRLPGFVALFGRFDPSAIARLLHTSPPITWIRFVAVSPAKTEDAGRLEHLVWRYYASKRKEYADQIRELALVDVPAIAFQ